MSTFSEQFAFFMLCFLYPGTISNAFIVTTWNTKIGARSTMEDSMLDFASDVNEDSRLSCQIRITPEMDGLEVHMPEEQG